MATKFIKNQEVKVNGVIPQGAIEKLRMDENGVFWYMFSWTDIDGNTQRRWFREEELVAA